MQSLQMRWPVAAAIGLSTTMIARAPIAWPSLLRLLELRDLLLERAAGQGHPERALLELRRACRLRRFLLESPGARILALLVAPDAVVGLVERAGEIGPGVGQLESLAPPEMLVAEPEGGVALALLRDDRNEPLRIQFRGQP